MPLELKAGSYSTVNAADLDKVLALAEKRGISVLLTLDNYGSFMEPGPSAWGENRWVKNPYNSANGGPLGSPDDYWTDAEVARLYKNRLRYILARWGSSAGILAFEIFNEVNTPAAWIKEMAGYGKSVDPHGRPWTTSIGYPWNDPYDKDDLWALPEMDYSTVHLYREGWKTQGDWNDRISSIAADYTKTGERETPLTVSCEGGVIFLERPGMEGDAACFLERE